MQMISFAQKIWLAEGDRIKLFQIPFDTRMTVVELENKKLWVHSPVAPTPELLSEVQKLGEVAYLVAPNKFHNLSLPAWMEHFPNAQVWVDPGLAKRKLKIAFHSIIKEGQSLPWEADLESALFEGSFILNEAVFFHKLSQTLIVTDILQNHDPKKENFFWRALKRMNGVLAPNGGCPVDWRWTVRDRDTARKSLQKILKWDFNRLVLSHGLCIEREAKPFVEKAFHWLS